MDGLGMYLARSLISNRSLRQADAACMGDAALDVQQAIQETEKA